jgi:hypothetical protein
MIKAIACAPVSRLMRVGAGAPIEYQEADAADDGECHELDAEHAAGLAGIDRRIVMNSTVMNKAGVCAARFRSS